MDPLTAIQLGLSADQVLRGLLPKAKIGGKSFSPSVLGLGGALLGSLFGGGEKSPQEKAIERLEKLAQQGLDPAILQRALAVLNARNQAEQSGVLSRLASGGIDPSSGLAQEAVGATRRGLGARQGEAQSLFNQQSEAAKLAANQQLLGLPADQSLGDLLGSGLQALQAYGQRNQGNQGLTFDDLKKLIPQAMPDVRTELPSAPRGSMLSQIRPLELATMPNASPNIGMKLPTPSQFSQYFNPYSRRRGYAY